MRVEIVPSLTVPTVAQFKSGLRTLEDFATFIHLDLMDGRFVKTKSISPAQLSKQTISRPFEVHAMVDRPNDWLSALSRLPLRRIYLHVELGIRLRPAIAWFRSRQVEVGLAINPKTRITALKPWISHVRNLLVLGVNPGRYGAAFQPTAVTRVKYLHHRYPKMMLVSDGGMNARTIPRMIRAGARRLVVGSDIQTNSEPDVEFRHLQQVARQTVNMVH